MKAHFSGAGASGFTASKAYDEDTHVFDEYGSVSSKSYGAILEMMRESRKAVKRSMEERDREIYPTWYLDMLKKNNLLTMEE